MEWTSIPNLNAKVSRIGLGTWAIGGWMWGGTDERDAIATIHHALDLGINLIDTAPVYGFGYSEELVGKAIKSYGNRDKIIIATKAGLSWHHQKIYRDARKEVLQKEIEASLRRLQTDYIDLYQLHWPDDLTPLSETAHFFHHLLKEGKIKAIGVSNFSIDQMKEFRRYAPLHTLQSPYNIFERDIEKKELAYCIENDIATLGYGSLCRSLLSGKMSSNRTFQGDDIRKIDPKFHDPHLAHYLACTKKLQDWAKNHYDKSLLSLAIRWNLDKNINIALWGARKPQQLDDLNAIWDWKLTPDDIEEIEDILEETIQSPVGPGFMAPPQRSSSN